jgi:uncharacterized membrane protein
MKKIKIVVASLVFQLLPLFVLAQSPYQQPPPVSLSLMGIRDIIEKIVNWVSGVLFFIGILMILWAAFRFMTAGGEEDAVKKAKSTLLYGLIGIGVAILAYSAWYFVASVLNPGTV